MLALINVKARRDQDIPPLYFSNELQAIAEKESAAGKEHLIMRDSDKPGTLPLSCAQGKIIMTQKVPDWKTITYGQYLDRSLQEEFWRQTLLSRRPKIHAGFAVAGNGTDTYVTWAVGFDCCC